MARTDRDAVEELEVRRYEPRSRPSGGVIVERDAELAPLPDQGAPNTFSLDTGANDVVRPEALARPALVEVPDTEGASGDVALEQESVRERLPVGALLALVAVVAVAGSAATSWASRRTG